MSTGTSVHARVMHHALVGLLLGIGAVGAAAFPLSGAAYAVLKERWSRRPAIR